MNESAVNAPEGVTETVSNWPGAFGAFKPSKKVVAFNLVNYLLLLVVSVFISSLPDLFISDTESALYSLLSIVATIISFVLSIGATVVLLRAARGEKIETSDALRRSLGLVLPYLGVSILTALILGLSLLLFVIPFFFVLPKVLLAMYYLIDQKLGPIAALKASWNDTKGNVGKVYGVIGATLVMFLPFITIIGIPVAIFLLVAYSAATILLYMNISQQAQPVAAPVVTPVAPLA